MNGVGTLLSLRGSTSLAGGAAGAAEGEQVGDDGDVGQDVAEFAESRVGGFDWALGGNSLLDWRPLLADLVGSGEDYVKGQEESVESDDEGCKSAESDKLQVVEVVCDCLQVGRVQLEMSSDVDDQVSRLFLGLQSGSCVETLEGDQAKDAGGNDESEDSHLKLYFTESWKYID